MDETCIGFLVPLTNGVKLGSTAEQLIGRQTTPQDLIGLYLLRTYLVVLVYVPVPAREASANGLVPGGLLMPEVKAEGIDALCHLLVSSCL
jgi:hypothetical protein